MSEQSQTKKKTKLISIKRKKVVNEGTKAQGTKLMLNQSQMLKGAAGAEGQAEATVEEQQMEDELVQPQQVYEYNGPQLRVSKTSISFKTDVVTAVNDSIQVSNVGSTAIKYEWVKVPQERHFQTSLHDEEERFFCHHRKNCIRPGQTMDFSFSFKSTVQGVFYEDWEIKTEPFCIYPIEKVKFTGMAVGEDQFTQKRESFMAAQQQEIKRQREAEQEDQQEKKAATPLNETEDLDDPQVQRRLFEERNRDKNLYYTELGVNWFKFLEGELRKELNISASEAPWNLDVKVVRDMIDRLRFDEQRDFLEKLYQEFLEFCRLRPYIQSPFYGYFREQLCGLAEEVIEHQSQARQLLEIWDNDFVAPTDEMTTQEWAKVLEKKEAVKQEYLKKAKKKKWGPEDEKAALDQVAQKTQEKLKESLATRLENLDSQEGIYVEHQQVLAQQRKQDYRYYNSLQNVKHLSEVDIEERKCILKVHLKIKEGPENEAKKEYYEQQVVLLEEQLKRMEEARIKAAQEDGKKKRKKNTTMAQTQLEQQETLIQLDFSFLDEENLQNVMANVKYLLDNQAKLIIMLVSYDKPMGRPFARGSIKFLQEMLQGRFENNHIVFQEDGLLIDDFNDKIENDYYQDNSILLMENLFFREHETGYCYSTEQTLRKVSTEEQNKFWADVGTYGNLLVVEDKFNLFSNYASLNRLKCDQNILGLSLAHDIRVLAHCMSLPRQNQMVLLGGTLSSFKLLALNQLMMQFDKIYVFGEMGLKLAMVQYNLGKIQGMDLRKWEEDMIGQVLKGSSGEVLVLPSGVVVQTKAESQEDEQEDGQEHFKQAHIEFDNLPEEEEWRTWQVVNFLESDMEQAVLEIKKSDKVLWMETLNLDLDHVELDLAVSNELFSQKQNKLNAIKNDKSHFHNYSQDQVTTVMGGALQTLLNQFQFVPDEDEEENVEQQEAQEEGVDAEEQEEEQVEKKERKKKARDNMQYVSDFYSGDSLLGCQLLSGLFCPGILFILCLGLQNIDRYDLIDDRDNDDQFSFLDEI